MKIFLVEDSLVARGHLAAMLATIPGAEIVGEAQSALPAIRDILALRPDLVLLDVHLAEGSGFDVLNAVHVNAPEIDFCMLTSFASQPYRQLAGQLGARAVFDKGREFERVRDLVARRVAVLTHSKETR
jgi:DNA-binding NarL/FixJ family response regulator